MPTKEDRRDAGERRADAAQTEAAHTPGDAETPAVADALPSPQTARRESFSTRAFAHRWSIVAGVCLFIAAAFLLMSRIDAAFVAATLGVVAWFWNERNRLRPHGIEAEEKFRDEDEEYEDRDDE
ncbi:MAG TPA: hypothetical protein VGB61_02345 [Pyrinomonadaceae bacterium]